LCIGAIGLLILYSICFYLYNVIVNYKTYNAINDSLFSQGKKNEIAGLEGKHNIAVKDNEIALNQLKLAGQRRTQKLFVVQLRAKLAHPQVGGFRLCARGFAT